MRKRLQTRPALVSFILITASTALFSSACNTTPIKSELAESPESQMDEVEAAGRREKTDRIPAQRRRHQIPQLTPQQIQETAARWRLHGRGSWQRLTGDEQATDRHGQGPAGDGCALPGMIRVEGNMLRGNIESRQDEH